MIEWQPIETAPKDGTKILLFGHIGVNRFFVVASWSNYRSKEYAWRECWGGCSIVSREIDDLSVVTHWSHLPIPQGKAP